MVAAWEETEDPYGLVADLLPGARRIAVNDAALPSRVRAPGCDAQVSFELAGPVIGELRMRKTAAEVAALQEAGAAIDWVHARVAGLLRPGVTEREVAARIADLILESGHATVDFVIVASGPNNAPAPTTRSPTGFSRLAIRWSWISAAPCPRATVRTAPGPTRWRAPGGFPAGVSTYW